MKRWAVLSRDKTCRFVLGRGVDELPHGYRTVLFVLNNPSIADAEIDDATVLKCWRYTLAWDYHRMIFVNCNPWRATDPSLAQIPRQSLLEKNDEHVDRQATLADLIVCAWGGNADLFLSRRATALLVATKKPLYLKGNLTPQIWRPT